MNHGNVISEWSTLVWFLFNVVTGVDFSASNVYQGERTFDGRNLHAIEDEQENPYQRVSSLDTGIAVFVADVLPVHNVGSDRRPGDSHQYVLLFIKS